MAMNQLEHNKDQENDNEAAAAPAAAREHHPAWYAVKEMLEDGVQDTGRVAKLLRQFPEAKAEVFKLLHQSLGNRFASQVEDLINLENSPTADEVKMPSHGTAKSRDSAADSMQDFAQINKVTPAERKGETAAQAGAGLKHEDTHENASAVGQATSKLGITMPTAAPAAAKDDGTVDTTPAAAPAAAKDDGTVDTKPAAAPAAKEFGTYDPVEHLDQRATVEPKAAPQEKAGIVMPPENAAAPQPENKVIETVQITASALRVRAAANLKGQVLGKIPRGGTAHVVEHVGVWLKIKWGGDGEHAFIHSKYTTKGNEGGEEEEQGEGESQEAKHEPKQERPPSTNKQSDENQTNHA